MIADTLFIALAISLGIIGIVGSFLPVLPGPPISWLGVLVMYLRFGSISGKTLLVWLAITTVVTVVDFIVPGWLSKVTGASKAAGWGATIGMIIGIFFTPIGMIIFGMLGAFLAEILFGSKEGTTSVVAAFGAFAGFFFGTFIKLIAAAWMFYLIIAAIF